MKPAEAGQNYKPLLALIDSYTGGNLAASVDASKAAETPEQRQYKIAQLSDLLSKRRGDITKQQADILKNASKGSGGSERTMARLIGMEKRQKRFEDKAVGRANEEIYKDTKKFGDSISDFNESLSVAEGALRSRDIRKINSVAAILARKISGEKGVLTDRDVGRAFFRTFGMTLLEYQAKIDLGETPQVKPENVQYMLELIHTSKTALLKSIDEKITSREELWGIRDDVGWKKTFQPEGYGRKSVDKLRERLQTERATIGTSAAPAVPQAVPAAIARPQEGSPAWSSKDQSELDALEQKYGGK